MLLLSFESVACLENIPTINLHSSKIFYHLWTLLISSLRKYAYSLKWNYIIVYKFPKSMITHVPCQSFVVVGGCADTKHRPLTLSASHISFLTRTRRENTFENIAFTYDLEGIIRIQSLLSCNLIYSRFFIIICQILSFNILNASLR